METLLKPRSAPARHCRDREMLAFLGRHGAASIEQVMRALGVGQAMAYRRVAECVDRGLVERLALLRDEPTLLRATRQGLRYAGLGHRQAEAGVAQALASGTQQGRLVAQQREALDQAAIDALGDAPVGHRLPDAERAHHLLDRGRAVAAEEGQHLAVAAMPCGRGSGFQERLHLLPIRAGEAERHPPAVGRLRFVHHPLDDGERKVVPHSLDLEHVVPLGSPAMIHLYGLPGSHPTMAVQRMLEHKGIGFRRIDLVPFLARAIVRRGMRLPHNTVPVLAIGRRRIQGSREIARELDRLHSDPALFPADPEPRRAVEEAERWGEEELQHPARQISLWAMRANREPIRSYMERPIMGMPRAMAARLASPFIDRGVRVNEATAAAVRGTRRQIGAQKDWPTSIRWPSGSRM